MKRENSNTAKVEVQKIQSVKFLTRINNNFEEIELQTSTFTEFGISCSPIYRKQGGFKKWFKKGYIIANGITYICRYHLISDLKKQFKSQILDTKKYTMSESKFSAKGHFEGERKATCWSYKLK